jgi:SAM-dependent methyltransferase
MSWAVACPECRTELGEWAGAPIETAPPRCPACDCGFARRDGVWDVLAPSRAGRFERFLAEYTAVRRAEGRGFEDPQDYRRLPAVDSRHPLAWQWRIRARSTEVLMGTVLPAVPAAPAGRADLTQVLDLGAGNGWLSYRLSVAGYAPLAVDLSLDGRDGLGAACHFNAALTRPFPCVRADFDHLPLAAGSVDVAIFNASFHYSPDYVETLAEARRVLRPGGGIVIMDSPCYHSHASGAAMVRERQARFQAQYGFPSDALGSREFLTVGELDELAGRLGLVWQSFTPRYGWRWALRPWLARLYRRREPASFSLHLARRPAEAAAAGA